MKNYGKELSQINDKMAHHTGQIRDYIHVVDVRFLAKDLKGFRLNTLTTAIKEAPDLAHITFSLQEPPQKFHGALLRLVLDCQRLQKDLQEAQAQDAYLSSLQEVENFYAALMENVKGYLECCRQEQISAEKIEVEKKDLALQRFSFAAKLVNQAEALNNLAADLDFLAGKLSAAPLAEATPKQPAALLTVIQGLGEDA